VADHDGALHGVDAGPNDAPRDRGGTATSEPHLFGARSQPTVAPDESLFVVDAERLAPAVTGLAAEGWRFATLVGTDDRPAGAGFGVEAVMVRSGQPLLRIRAELSAQSPSYPSIGRSLPAALWDEREAHDLLGIVPVGHPDLRRLVLHETYPDGFHPLRYDAPATVPEGHPAVPFQPFVAHGEGVYDLPVGPIHAGVIEPGHFRFSAMGESILYLDARLFFTHRGIEKLVEGRTLDAALPVVERSCGVCTVTHATAFSRAVERLAGPSAEPPPRAVVLRAVLAEMERLYNHVGDLGNICAGIGFNLGSSQLGWVKEQLLRLNESVSGHRYLMGVVAPGGLAFDLPSDALAALPDRLVRLADDAEAVLRIVDGTEAVWDRLRGAGHLAREMAETLGSVGVAARASGIAVDTRADLPVAPYGALGVAVAGATEGDVAARFAVRRAEAAESVRLILELLIDVPPGDIRAPVGGLPSGGAALGWAEGPRGVSWLWLRAGPEGRIDRMRLRSASFANWPSVAASAAGNLVPDFPLINKSFELCHACTDR